MMMIVYIAALLIGFVCLVKGADIFVDGSSGVAKAFHVPGLIIGLTIVALGTSAPELAVSVVASLQGSNEIAFSNVIGSNLFNLLMVLGICAIIKPLPLDDEVRKRDFPLYLIATLFVFLVVLFGSLPVKLPITDMAEDAGVLVRPAGIIMLVVFIGYLAFLVYGARNNKDENQTQEKQIPLWKCAIMIIAGLAMIVGGGEVVVYGAKNIALAMGLTETLVGLTVVAVGTSLPELVTSLVAAKKGETGLAVGNVVGSNIFNTMLILGVSSAINPITVNYASLCDISILLLISLMTWIFSFTDNSIKRPEGIIMVLCYAAHMTFAVLR